MPYGPTLPISIRTHTEKYRQDGESFEELCARLAAALSDSERHRKSLKEILLDQRFLPAGRIQAAVGAVRRVTPYNCYVSGTIMDSMDDIMEKAKEAAQTMRMGGGIGYDFSTLRPDGNRIVSLNSSASGPISFMEIYDSVCNTVRSAGHRRGAQMGVLRVDHPDIEAFIRSKQNSNRLTNFNISVGITDEFMNCIKKDRPFQLRFRGQVQKEVNAKELWEGIMRANWDWGEPGVLFMDVINRKNNLWYCETIAATNPCGEQPLPPYGACLLGSFNLTRYIQSNAHHDRHEFDYEVFASDIAEVVRAMDNVIDNAIYPLPQQEHEARSKRRMGLGVTGVANAIEIMGFSYGSNPFRAVLEDILKTLRDVAYYTSAQLAKEKGAFPLFRPAYCDGPFIQTLPKVQREMIRKHGIRNSHLLSIAPCGTISLCADNISSGIEPVFRHEYSRVIIEEGGPKEYEVSDYNFRVYNLKGKTADKVTPNEHVKVLTLSQKYMDSSVSKTCNVGSDVTWDEFNNIYFQAYEGGAKGCTTFRDSGKREGILKERKEENGTACYIDPDTGTKTCDE